MNTPPIPHDAVRRACRDLGLADDTADALLGRLLADPPTGSPPVAEPPTSRELEMMRLLKTATPERLIHDLRNVLNENALLRAAADF